MKLYYHKTDGGAEYYCTQAVKGTDEGDMRTAVLRVDGDEFELNTYKQVMNVEEEFKTFLYEWVEKMYGQNEAYNPSWDIKTLAHDLREEYIKIKEREDLEWVKEDVEYVAENHDIKLTDKQAYAVAQEYMLSEAYCEMHAEDILYFIQREKEKE